eukprot:CAMPEP_0172509326 /NCGR_PEP_ID=MMETSP1066-20121228/219365_1 /TAXON_ID=671091 /ORGANISM="Coscinodiscus wailesii, Strain CCMP2513" /LENGTH=315 /DNA_ID=CAMNT_0013287747 /DNA_START=17 /DNA_END=964 /DNA_ORIENTATION=-
MSTKVADNNKYSVNDLSNAVMCLTTLSKDIHSPPTTPEYTCDKVASNDEVRDLGDIDVEDDETLSAPMTFPQKLMEILSNEELSDIIAWLHHGRGFIVHQKKRFAAEVLPRYFRQVKYTSFTRKLNRWLFIRIARGPEAGAYYHKYFRKDEPRLCLKMICHSVAPPVIHERIGSGISRARRPKPTQGQISSPSIPPMIPRELTDTVTAVTKSRIAQECNEIMNDILKLQELTRTVTLQQQVMLSELRYKQDRHRVQHGALLNANVQGVNPIAAIRAASFLGRTEGQQQSLRSTVEETKSCAQKQRPKSLENAFAA